jgi:hypothetical protein
MTSDVRVRRQREQTELLGQELWSAPVVRRPSLMYSPILPLPPERFCRRFSGEC